MKKTFATLLVLVLIFSLSACGEKDNLYKSFENITNPPSSNSQDKEEAQDENQNSDIYTETSQDAHIHIYSEATCTEPAECSCGITNGKELGHTWLDATCTTAKTCSRCGVESETPLGHNYEDGTCSRCNASDPNYSPDEIELSSLSISDQHFYEHITDTKLVKDTVGNTYTTGNLFAIGSGGSYTGQKKPPFATYYLGGKYSTLTLDIAIYADGGASEAYFIIHDENNKSLYQTDYINRQFAPQKLTLDVTGIEWLTFKLVEREQMDINVVMLLSNPILHK